VLQQVQEYARAQQYDLVIADAIFVSTAIDITDKVLAALKPAAGGRQ
jgi:Skp family chaperone for outer membrane proteins